MESSNILSAAIRATDDVLQNTMLGDGLSFLNETGCSLFFVTSSISSMVTGNKNRAKAIDDAIADIEFQEELQRQKEQYEDAKENADIEFKLKMKLIQRQHSREQNCLKLKNDQQLNQLEMLFSGWPLASSVGGILNHVSSSSIYKPNLNVVIGRVYTESDKDPISLTYKDPAGMSKGITDIVIDTLSELGFTKDRLHLMNDKCQLYGGALFANIFAVMHSLPTIVISPTVYDGKLHFNIGCWNQDSSFPYQDDVLIMDYNSTKAKSESPYKESKIKEYIQSVVAIAAVFNDTFLLSEGRMSDVHYLVYAKNNHIYDLFPRIKDFAIKEYSSLLENPQADILKECDIVSRPSSVINQNHFNALRSKVNDLLDSLIH